MALFNVPVRADKSKALSVAKKSNEKSKASSVSVRSGGGLMGRISAITAMVEKNLSQYESESIIIQDADILHNYISKSIENGVIAIDTETTGLDPLRDSLVGICIYTPGEKTAYIPLHHVSYITFMPVPNQLSTDIVRDEFQRVADAGIDNIMFNSAFDIRFMRHGLGVNLVCSWDCFLAARCLNENEGAGNNGLKKLHQKYVLNGVGDAFKFDDLFKGIPFSQIPIKVGYLYAAHDAIITYELYQYQKPFLTADNEECIKRGLEDVAWVFHHIEMPCVAVVADMEDNGITFDFEYNNILKEKYHQLLEEKIQDFYDECDNYIVEIETYRINHSDCKLDDPINVASPSQIATLLYDILQLPQPIDKKTKKPLRGTGEEILSNIDHPICKKILDYRGTSKLIDTYIDKMPECVNPDDGRVHCKFNQYGADTGRFSSNDPNLKLWACA